MRLNILRHAKTDQFSETGKDFDRKLLKKGICQAIELGKYFKKHEINPPHIFCSSAVRTRETLSIIQEYHRFNSEIVYRNDFYLKGKDQLLSFLWEQNHGEDILIIGHNNGISDFAAYLVADFIDLKTAEFISVDFDEKSWKETSKRTGIIRQRFHPNV